MNTPDYLKPFLSSHALEVSDSFLSSGYVIVDIESQPAFQRIQEATAAIAARFLNQVISDNSQQYLDRIHSSFSVEHLNALRLHVIQALNQEDWLRPAYFSLAQQVLETLVGNELTMQRRLNLSIQLPGDDSSLLETHADTWSGDSPYELVLWVPLVDCYDTKSMYLLPEAHSQRYQSKFSEIAHQSSESLFQMIQGDIDFLSVSAGQAVLFSQNLMHGNRVNETEETRWSLNCRFKSLLSPYVDKRHAEFFEPIKIAPMTRLAMNYRLPEVENA